MSDFLNTTLPRILVSGFIAWITAYALFNEGVSEGIQMSLMGVFGAMAHHWLGTSASSAAKSKMLQGELAEDNVIAPARPPSKL